MRTIMEPQSSANTRFLPPRRVATEPTVQVPRRSYSVSSTSSRSGSVGASRGSEDLVETLFTHPSVKIIAFTSSQRGSLGSSSLSNEPAPGSLPPSSQLERTIAVGPFRIYRAPGSVAFLSCGSALQPILPKSQCWCIDEGNSRFVLQIRRPQYWRIEVPREDVHRAQTLRDVFDKILLFEKTECPFQRSFTVELPERPQTPVKKKAWTPVGKNLVSSPLFDLSPTSPSSVIANTKTRTKATVNGNSTTKEQSPSGDQEIRPSLAKRFRLTEPNSLQENRELPVENRRESATTQSLEDQIESVAEAKVENHTDGRSLVNQHDDGADTNTQAAATPARSPTPLEERTAPQAALPVQSEIAETAVSVQHPRLPETPVSESRNISGRLGERAEQTAAYSERSVYPDSPSPSPSTTQPSLSLSAMPISVLEKENVVPSTVSAKTTGSEKPNGLLVPSSSTAAEEILGDAVNDCPQSFEGAGSVGAVNLKKKRMSRMLAGRSVTLPPQLTLVTSPPSKSNSQFARADLPTVQTPAEIPPSPTLEQTSPDGSTDSFHSVQSWHSPLTPLPPSPPSSTPSPAAFPFPHGNIIIPKHHLRGLAELTITPNTDATYIPGSAGATICSFEAPSPMPRSPLDDSKPTSPSSVEHDSGASRSSALVERPRRRHRPRPNNLSVSSRGFSPLPPAVNLFSPPNRRRQSNRLEVVRRLPSTIMHKTVEILLSPPSHLVNLMLKVAAKIAAGEWRGLVFGFGEGGEQIPVQWDYSDGEYSSWDDEDYTFSMGRLSRRSTRSESVSKSGSDAGGWNSAVSSTYDDDNNSSWEVD